MRWFTIWSSSHSSLLATARSASLALPSGGAASTSTTSSQASALRVICGKWLSLALFTMVGAICFYTGKLIDRCIFLILEGDNIEKLLPGTVVKILGVPGVWEAAIHARGGAPSSS
uniref:Uncharacterized protein n=1 Tax=Oryza rufipogon TaxID=4529 RepID=A0A0E0Q0G3_ORYRU